MKTKRTKKTAANHKYLAVRFNDSIGSNKDYQPKNRQAREIIEEGTIPERRLFRRWVMGQMMHIIKKMRAMAYECKDYSRENYFDAGLINEHTLKDMFACALQSNHTTEYQWKMLLEEMRVQNKLQHSDPENFAKRNRWFNKDTVLDMCMKICIGKDFFYNYDEDIDAYYFSRSGNYAYISRHGYVNQTGYDKIDNDIKDAVKKIQETPADDIRGLYNRLLEIEKIRPRKTDAKRRSYDDTWLTAYMGSGAYYTWENLILFHDATLPNMDRTESLRHIEALAEKRDAVTLMKELLDYMSLNDLKYVSGEVKKGTWRDTNTSVRGHSITMPGYISRKMNTDRGVSILLKNGTPETERYTDYLTSDDRIVWLYDYLHTNGDLFSCMDDSLEKCRMQRDAWLKQKGWTLPKKVIILNNCA